MLWVTSLSERSNPHFRPLNLLVNFHQQFVLCVPSGLLCITKAHEEFNCGTDNCNIFLKLDDKGLMFQMCFV